MLPPEINLVAGNEEETHSHQGWRFPPKESTSDTPAAPEVVQPVTPFPIGHSGEGHTAMGVGELSQDHLLAIQAIIAQAVEPRHDVLIVQGQGQDVPIPPYMKVLLCQNLTSGPLVLKVGLLTHTVAADTIKVVPVLKSVIMTPPAGLTVIMSSEWRDGQVLLSAAD